MPGNRNTFLTLGLIVIIIISYMLFLKTEQFTMLQNWAQQNLVLFFIFLVVIKVIGIVFPPLPGGLLTLGAIPITGWFLAYLADLTGFLLGASGAYYIGKKYGYKILHKLFDQNVIDKINKVKIRKHRELESVFVLRVAFGGSLTEIICYAAGILGVGYVNFFAGSLLSHIVVGVPGYYFASNILEAKNILINLAIVAVAAPILWKLKGRYLE